MIDRAGSLFNNNMYFIAFLFLHTFSFGRKDFYYNKNIAKALYDIHILWKMVFSLFDFGASH